MENFRFKDFKALNYPDPMSMNDVLSDLLYKGVLNIWDIISPYTEALEKERHLNNMRFEEACINLTQILGKNFRGERKKEATKRAIHTFNLTKTLVPHIHDAEYNYTVEDEKEWDNFCKTIYGTDLKK
jgi:hypothetical protein